MIASRAWGSGRTNRLTDRIASLATNTVAPSGDQRLAGEPGADQHRADHRHVDADRHRQPGRRPARCTCREHPAGRAPARPPGRPARAPTTSGRTGRARRSRRRTPGGRPGTPPAPARKRGTLSDSRAMSPSSPKNRATSSQRPGGAVGRAQHDGGHDQQHEHERLRDHLQPAVVARHGVPVDERGSGRQQPDQLLGHGQSMAGTQRRCGPQCRARARRALTVLP